MKRFLVCGWLLCAGAFAADEIVFEDFEGENYGAWKAEGEAFGAGPARGALPGQMSVTGYRGKGLVNSFLNGDRTRGRLISPNFTVERDYISFFIGAGGFDGKTCINLIIDGATVQTAAGPNTQPGGSEALEPGGWDVRELRGKKAHIEIVDDATDGWGHINIDHVVFTDTKPPAISKWITNAQRDIEAQKPWLHLPVKNGAKKRIVTVRLGNEEVRKFDIELADAEPDWLAPLDISEWQGKKLTVRVDRLQEGSRALDQLTQADDFPEAGKIYKESLRPQFHFSAKRGWLNDPNGLVHFEGKYHLFFQHNPYGWGWGNMHWGHATSPDLVHWTEHSEALYPDAMGTMFSGSAVVDWKNTSGFGKDGVPPIVLFYTAAGKEFTQGLAYSTDKGRTFTKYEKNPIVAQITHGNRDPKVIWHEPSKRWVMVLYVEHNKVHTIHFLTSENLRDWTDRSRIDGLFECPDFFELPVEGEPGKRLWFLTGASSEYLLGSFDGQKFAPETPKLPGHRGKGFYAAQTFSDMPDGRRVQIGWMQAPSPGVPFNQCMSLPLELTLRRTADGPRLAMNPVPEAKTLRANTVSASDFVLGEDNAKPIADWKSGNASLELRAEFEPGNATVEFDVHGVHIAYDGAKQELRVNDHAAPAPLRDGKQSLAIFLDRTVVEVFASEGLTYIPVPVIADRKNQKIELRAKGATAKVKSIQIYELNSSWR